MANHRYVRALLFAVILIVLVGGVVWASADEDRPASRVASATSDPPAPGKPAESSAPQKRRRRATPLPASKCADTVAGCRTVSGRVVYLESVDPDGDGDLHVVLTGRDDVTGAGFTAVDVPPELRPGRDPRVGDRMSAAGPVQRGSHGQSQVHALELHLRRR